MKINNNTVVDRSNRPGVLQRVALRTLFLNDGSYTDPYAISSVTVFRLVDNTSPSSLLTSGSLLDITIASATVLMGFANSSTLTSNSAFSSTNYTPGTTASGIFKLNTGEYAVVLDGSVALSGGYEGTRIENRASSVDSYIDIWTVKFSSNGGWNLVINQFNLYDDTFFAITEPLLIKARTVLTNKKVQLGSKVDLVFNTDLTISNRNIGTSIKNIFKDSVLLNPQLRIYKGNDDNNLPSRVEVSGYSDTSALIDVTADNTLVFNWDTNNLSTLSAVLAGTFGPLTGAYYAQLKYTILNQTIVTDPMALIVS